MLESSPDYPIQAQIMYFPTQQGLYCVSFWSQYKGYYKYNEQLQQWDVLKEIPYKDCEYFSYGWVNYRA